MFKKLLCSFLASFLLVGSVVNAQDHFCAFDNARHYQEARFPGYLEAADAALENAKARYYARSSKTADEEFYRLPVVVHLVHNVPEQEISDDLVYSQIEVLNESFNRLNENASETREIFQPFAASANIEFYLAETDPDGEPTTGIVRVESPNYYFVDFLGGGENGGLDNIKSSATGGSDPWDPEKYINIWVGNFAFDLFGLEQVGVLGFAYAPVESTLFPPETFPSNIDEVDGVCIDYRVFGRNNPIAETIDLGNGTLAETNSEGRTCVHEMGHYLGLRHIWGDGGNPLLGTPGTCDEDDFIDDTPRATSSSQQVCNPSQDTCPDDEVLDGIDDALAYPDMIENYMDYSTEQCQNMFTMQQVGVMREMLTLYREGLLESNPTGIEDGSNAVISMSLYPNPSAGLVQLDIDGVRQGKIEVRDATGKVVRQMPVDSEKAVLDLQDVSRGVYFVQFTSGKIKISERIVLH